MRAYVDAMHFEFQGWMPLVAENPNRDQQPCPVLTGEQVLLIPSFKVAPTFLSALSRLRLSRPSSPSPPSEMGQQPSKKTKKGAKDKDGVGPSPESPSLESQNSLPSQDDSSTPQSSLSKATGASSRAQPMRSALRPGEASANGGDDETGLSPSKRAAGSAESNGSISRLQNGGLVPPSPTVPSSLTPSSTTDLPSQLYPSSAGMPSPPSRSRYPDSPAPIDIPTTTTILSNPVIQSGLPPGSIPGSLAAQEKARALDVDDMISRLLEVGYTGKAHKSVCLKNAEITALCQAAREIFLGQPTLIELSPPVKIVGDVHGQYSDLIRLFEMCGFPPSANYLFLGDYVDRGKQSLETILLLLCYKIKYPENFFLLRGNHECANVTRVYGFYDECKRRCNIKIWKTFIDVFNCLPIAAVVASKIFCVHGGLSPSLHSMEDIRRIQRPTDVPDFGLLNDLLWSDPSDTALDWEDNERGVSYCFGKAIINDFLGRYDMDLICRAHMVVEDGYEFWNDRTLVTVFSAPNYCGEFDNYGACMSVSEELLCAFELLKPLDGPALRKEMAKAKRKSLMAAPGA